VHLVRGEHERRQIEAALEHVADSRLAADRHALRDERGDVAVDGALAGLGLLGDGLRGERRARTAEDLDDLEEAVGASHRAS